MDKNIPVQEHYHTMHLFKRISWTAIVVGALTAVGLGFLFNLFGLAIELSAFKSLSNGSQTIAIGGLLGIIVGVIASMLAAGYAAGYLGRLYCPARNLGIVYGFTTWVIALLLSAIVVGHLSNYATAYSNAISHTVVTTSQTNTTVTAASPSSHPVKQPTSDITVSTTTIAEGAFVVFVLFFISAFFSCVGACWGMSCKRED